VLGPGPGLEPGLELGLVLELGPELEPVLELALVRVLEPELHSQPPNHQPMPPAEPKLTISFFYSFSPPFKRLEPHYLEIHFVESYHLLYQ